MDETPASTKLQERKKNKLKNQFFKSKLLLSGRWNVHSWIAEGAETGGSLQGEIQPGIDLRIILNFVFNFNFRYLRSPLVVSVMKNVWRCLKINFRKNTNIIYSYFDPKTLFDIFYPDGLQL